MSILLVIRYGIVELLPQMRFGNLAGEYVQDNW